MIEVITAQYAAELSRLAAIVYECESLCGRATVETVFAGEARLRAVNRQMRGIDQATDVLSFPALKRILPFDRTHYPLDFDESTGCVHLGSILISRPAVKMQAAAFGHSERRERAYLFVHGLLHLLGYDHETEAERAAMREKEETVLTGAGITR